MKRNYQKAVIKVTVFFLLFILFTTPFSAVTYAKDEKAYEASTKKQLIDEIKNAMIERKTKFQVYYDGDYKEIEKWIHDDGTLILNDIFSADDSNTSDDADYLQFSYNCEEGIEWWIRGRQNELVFGFATSYFTSKEEDDYVNKQVADILDKLNLYDKTPYEKIKTIYDYIINNVEYDDSKDYSNLKMFSAYAGLVDGKMVCNGYALLLYKMLTEVNIECKIISGFADGGYHAWNIVKIGNDWYNVDVTWDDPGEGRLLEYRYFLKNNRDFVNHKRDKEYSTNGFYKKYPMSATSYKLSDDNITLNKTDVTINQGEKITLEAILSKDTKVIWKSSNSKLATVSKNGVVKGIKKGKVTITARTSNGKSVTCVVMIK